MTATWESLIDRGVVAEEVPLGPLTTYKLGGPARFYAGLSRQTELDDLVASGITKELPVLVLGRGSNLVVSSRGFDGLVIHLDGDFKRIEIAGTTVSAGSAAPLPRLARASAEAGIAGLEFFVGVPGSVGGAVRQNAGCFGSETKDCLLRAEIVDLKTGEKRGGDPDSLQMSYRHTNLSRHDLVVEAVFAGTAGDRSRSLDEIRRITRWRKENQPGGTLNAGSVFKNPGHISAGELIDNLGLKGFRVGDVSVSTKHANFFVAGPGATPEDVRELVTAVKDQVREREGTILQPEIQFVGFEE